MPPFVPRKRERADHDQHDVSPGASKPPRKKLAISQPKASVFDAIDQPATFLDKSAKEKNRLLEDLHSENEDSSSLSGIDSDDFEDVPVTKRPRLKANQSRNKAKHATNSDSDRDDEDEDESDEFAWEDAIADSAATPGKVASHHDDGDIADISIAINENGHYIEPVVPGGVNKKGPSKRERQIRINTHCLHVQSLLWHNSIRNRWLNDKKLQEILVQGLPEGVKREVLRWKEGMGRLSKEELEARKREIANKHKSKKGRKGKQKALGREWHYDADHLEQGVPDLSHGDPLFRLLKVLAAYWRKRFFITAPGLRKQGYKDLRRMRDEIRSWTGNPDSVEEHGERISSVKDLQECARKCEGSRDVGAQLFVALLRGLGLECRMIANLQPIGFGWSKGEDALPKRKKMLSDTASQTETVPATKSESIKINERKTHKASARNTAKVNGKGTPKTAKGGKADPISLSDSDSPLSDVPDDAEDDHSPADDDSVLEVLPPSPKRRVSKKYDRDLAYPVYWAEVCSPVTNKYIPVDAVVLSTIGSNEDLVQSLEPRGKKAENAKQVICYTVAHNADGSAKDVTIRYLKKHQLPGKTKGVRIPAEKIAIHNRKGKVIKYEEYDWFKSVMILYERPRLKRTKADDLEESTDLKPFKAATQAQETEKESLQWYKQSAEFVLEQHLRREEALVPGAQPVRTFTAGKGDKAKDHPVYLRADVVACKTVESWHKEGRELREGEHPMKLVPTRAVTLVRKREIEDALRETGEKLKQGLYSRDQTDWIIPPPIENGVIPKNAFGNIDVYVPTMVPKGAVHLPLKGSAKVCRKLEINFAEACTGFEFGKQRAVPVLTGVVVAKENEKLVRDAWREDQAERKRKEDTKRTALTLHWWRKMLLGLRVIERLRIEYQGVDLTEQEINPFVARAQRQGKKDQTDDNANHHSEEMAGGFILSDGEVDTAPSKHSDDDMGGGFMLDDDANDETNGELVLHDDLDGTDSRSQGPVTPMSLQSVHKATPPVVNDDSNADSDESDSKPKPKRKRAKITVDNESRPDASKSKTERSVRTSGRLASKQSQDAPAKTRGRRAKATPLKSQYFDHSEGSDGDAYVE